jgi:5-formyltetrahydrofolate cyclo-ligase
MRARRRRLTSVEQAAAASGIARVIGRSRLLRPGCRVAVYHSHRREADLTAVIALARRLGCVLYLPAITHRRNNRMDFVRADANTPLRLNSFGILEPARESARRIPVRELDLILLPLVAVDERGWRLGSGVGFYDRRLHHLQAGRHWRRPKLIGIAYEFQRVPRLEAQPWDVPLDAVVTERHFYPIARQS